ncbi:50S ribosomal protein L24 [bacterium]|nr:50S ribosomal protein L24 [bacterium]
MKLRKGDQVLVINGKDRGKKGKILRAFPKDNKILVDGVAIHKKHVRPKKEGEKGQIVEVISPISASKVKLICPHCKKPTRVGYKVILQGDNRKLKVRICKRCGEEI